MLTGCTADWRGFFAPQFEDIWWQPSELEWCFNFHYNDVGGVNELLVYEDTIQNYGEWVFEEPNVYNVDNYSVTVLQNGDCWDLRIDPFSALTEDLYACECTTR